jgi:hypothetical protein
MPSPRAAGRGQIQPVVAIAFGLIAIVGLATAVLASRPASPSVPALPSAPPSAAPTTAPTPAPTTAPIPDPTPPPSAAHGAGGSLSVDLENATGHKVSILIHDETGKVAGAVSGKPGDGMSVRWHDAVVKNVDDHSIAITWAALPGDDVANLGIDSNKGAYHLTLVQPGPLPYSDAMGEDRVLVLIFDAPVAAKNVSIQILDRTVD